jgi:hypothetical protein
MTTPRTSRGPFQAGAKEAAASFFEELPRMPVLPKRCRAARRLALLNLIDAGLSRVVELPDRARSNGRRALPD